MKKALVAKIALAGAVGMAAAIVSSNASATDCNFCHTMHNSQNGVSMRYDTLDSPLPILLRGSCFYCHSGSNTAANLLTSPPAVMATAGEPNYSVGTASGAAGRTLAGGDFWWVNTDDAKGHNITYDGWTIAETTIPGAATGTAPGGGALGAALRCAGTYGCHGSAADTIPINSLSGAHHSVHNTITTSAVLNGDTIGTSFRYLSETLGYEDSDWQHTETAVDHNYYYGKDRAGANAGAAATNKSLSELCARCHGAYHNSVDNPGDTYGINTDNAAFSGSWIRHPTDHNVPLAGEYASYNLYDTTAPVGRSNLASAAIGSDVSTADLRIVVCVSCHRAHGSPYDDALRWDYGTMDVGTTGAGAGTGCFACHALKDGS